MIVPSCGIAGCRHLAAVVIILRYRSDGPRIGAACLDCAEELVGGGGVEVVPNVTFGGLMA